MAFNNYVAEAGFYYFFLIVVRSWLQVYHFRNCKFSFQASKPFVIHSISNILQLFEIVILHSTKLLKQMYFEPWYFKCHFCRDDKKQLQSSQTKDILPSPSHLIFSKEEDIGDLLSPQLTMPRYTKDKLKSCSSVTFSPVSTAILTSFQTLCQKLT